MWNFWIHFIEETILDKLDFIACAQDEFDVFPFIDGFIGLFNDVLEDWSKKFDILLKNFLMNRHLIEFVQDQTNVNMKLSIDGVWVEISIHFFNYLAVPFELNVDFL